MTDAPAPGEIGVGDRVVVESEGQLGMTTRSQFYIRRPIEDTDKYLTADGGMLRHSQIVGVTPYGELDEESRSVRAVPR